MTQPHLNNKSVLDVRLVHSIIWQQSTRLSFWATPTSAIGAVVQLCMSEQTEYD